MESLSPRARALLVGAAVVIALFLAAAALLQVLDLARPALIPVAVGVLLTGLLMPVQIVLNHRLHLPRHFAAGITLTLAATAVGALVWNAGAQLATGISQVSSVAVIELSSLRNWLNDAPIPFGAEGLDAAIQSTVDWFNRNRSSIAAGAVDASASAANFLVAVAVCLFTTYFMLAQGDRIAAWFVLLLPPAWRGNAYEAGRRGWVTLSTYTRVQVLLAAADTLGIVLGLIILDIPFVVPLAAITFVLCLVPVVGAVVSGALVTLVTFAFQGPTAAIVALIIVITVQQLETSVLAPLLMGRAVNLHPLAVLLSVTTASYLLGFVGALFAVPVVATVNCVWNYFSGRDPFPALADGGSALTDSPRRLARDLPTFRIPPKIGNASPAWLLKARGVEAAIVDEVAEDAPDDRDSQAAPLERTDTKNAPSLRTHP